jgi:hypothetical protein
MTCFWGNLPEPFCIIWRLREKLISVFSAYSSTYCTVCSTVACKHFHTAVYTSSLLESSRVNLLLLYKVRLSKKIYIFYSLCIKNIYLTKDIYFLFILYKIYIYMWTQSNNIYTFLYTLDKKNMWKQFFANRFLAKYQKLSRSKILNSLLLAVCDAWSALSCARGTGIIIVRL